jgi:phosphatidylinositol alpha-1,6-mannosyltransferase
MVKVGAHQEQSDPSSMRLLLVTQDFPPAFGGIQTYSKALADEFARSTDAFGVVAPYERGCRQVDAQLPYAVHRVMLPRNLMRWTMLPYLQRVCQRHGYTVALLAQWYGGSTAAVLRRRGILERVFCAAHGQELLRVPGRGSWLGDAYERHRSGVLAAMDGFFPVSSYTGSLLTDLGVSAARIHVVKNGTDVRRFHLDASGLEQLSAFRSERGLGKGPLLLTAARLVRRKGIDIVLRALPQIAAVLPDVRYAVVGTGPEEATLKRMAVDLGINDRVAFLGKVSERDVVLAYNACDVFVMPARFEYPSVEGFGLVFREANACGKPVIGTATGGIVDAIDDGQTGLLVEPDNVEAFAGAAVKLLSDAKYATTLGQQGRALVETSGTWRHAAESMLQMMRSYA